MLPKLPLLIGLWALPRLIDARAVAAPSAGGHPANAERIIDIIPTGAPNAILHKRALLPPPAAGEYEPPTTATRFYVTTRSSDAKNAFLEWATASGQTQSFQDNIDKYPNLEFSVALAPGVGSDPDNKIDETKWNKVGIDTGSPNIIYSLASLGGYLNLQNIDPTHYNGYAFFPLDGARLILGRWVRLKVTLRGKVTTGNYQKVIATPTVLIPTYFAVGCTDFDPNANGAWPNPNNLGAANEREKGVKACNDPNWTDPGITQTTMKWNTTEFTSYFGVGWGSANKQVPLAAQFVRRMTSITDGNGATWAVGTNVHQTGYSVYKGYQFGQSGMQFGNIAVDDCVYYHLQGSVYSDDWTRPNGCMEFFDSSGNLISGGCQAGIILPDSGAGSLSGWAAKSGGVWPGSGGFQIDNPTTSGGYLKANAKTRFFLGGRWNLNFPDHPERNMGFDLVTYATNPPPTSVCPAGDNFGSGSVFAAGVCPGGHRMAVPAGVGKLNYLNGEWTTYGMFANTGRRFFGMYDMCWDPFNGNVGFRPQQAAPWNGQSGGSCVYCGSTT